MAQKVRLGGMALENGVLVHGPTSWACAVRTEGRDIRLASGRKPIRSSEIESPLLRGPARLAEVFALLPLVRRRLPDARLPYERGRVVAALAGSAAAVRGIRGSRLAPALQEAVAAFLALAPAALAMRGSALAEYHGAEHITIGTYEHDEPRPREHERCGSHLVGPLLVTSAAGGLVARAAPPHLRLLARAGAAVGAMASSVELFSWMVRNQQNPVARALARPGQELQERVLTAEPSPEQLEVAGAALEECLRLELAQDRSLESSANGDRDGADAPPT
jgi:uncharacterized protein YqhQ